MTYYADLSEHTMIAAGSHVRAIGWLDDKHGYPKGIAPAEFVHKLRRITESETLLGLYENESECLLHKLLGLHTCELCDNYNHGDDIVVPSDQVMYVAPKMIVHYIKEHGYLPPEQFIDAVLKSPFPGTKDYEDAVAADRDLHKRDQERQCQEYFEEASRRANALSSPVLDRIVADKKMK